MRVAGLVLTGLGYPETPKSPTQARPAGRGLLAADRYYREHVLPGCTAGYAAVRPATTASPNTPTWCPSRRADQARSPPEQDGPGRGHHEQRDGRRVDGALHLKVERWPACLDDNRRSGAARPTADPADGGGAVPSGRCRLCGRIK